VNGIDPAELIVDLLAHGHAVRFRAMGSSMHPVIRSDDYLHVEPIGDAEIETGDVVLALAERGLTAHRVIRSGDGLIVTRGDNSLSADAPLKREAILGRVAWVDRGGEQKRVEPLSPLELAARRIRMRIRR
jgi:signal peptidase I